MNTRPIPLTATLKEKVWGGSWIKSGAQIGEAWLLVDLDDEQSIADDGRSLTQILQEHGDAVISPSPKRFPLLIKLIDTAQDLSVQVHPDGHVAAQIAGAESKDEAWYIVDAEPGASILLGLREGVTADDFRAALETGKPEACLERIEVKKGDVFHIRPGTIHAIGAGIRLIEAQETSDTTFRLWDYERPGLDGKPRELHVADGLRSVRDLGPGRRVKTETLAAGDIVDHELLLSTDIYRIERVRFKDIVRLNMCQSSPAIVVPMTDGIGIETRVDAARPRASQKYRATLVAQSANHLVLSSVTSPGALESVQCEVLIIGVGNKQIIEIAPLD